MASDDELHHAAPDEVPSPCPVCGAGPEQSTDPDAIWRSVCYCGHPRFYDYKVRKVAISLVISEPWELARTTTDPPRHAVVERVSTGVSEVESGLVQVADPIEWRDGSFRYLVVVRRDGTTIAADLSSGVSIECSFIGQPDERATGSAPLDTSWWRGGLAGTATLIPDRAT